MLCLNALVPTERVSMNPLCVRLSISVNLAIRMDSTTIINKFNSFSVDGALIIIQLLLITITPPSPSSDTPKTKDALLYVTSRGPDLAPLDSVVYSRLVEVQESSKPTIERREQRATTTIVYPGPVQPSGEAPPAATTARPIHAFVPTGMFPLANHWYP